VQEQARPTLRFVCLKVRVWSSFQSPGGTLPRSEDTCTEDSQRGGFCLRDSSDLGSIFLLFWGSVLL